ncbi:acyl-CoA dehydrogenase family protein [Acidicapsa ligni]|uniref:acyl-CoA dehydrogenase family protein n=1 Tax=Acidicapsa ligni TaxID=542300 RepID=UPI0021E03DB5|nr:acyl-CoA dehydrogenase family protein [Acidicapsa ligni]
MSSSTLSATSSIVAAAGGSFLLEDRLPGEVFTPEDLSEEQRQIADTAGRFVREQVLPMVAKVEAKEPGVMRELLRAAADLGFTAVDVAEEYGGLGLDKTTSAVVADHLSGLASFATAFGAHAGIGTLPLVWYGTEEQKQRYLPKLVSLEWAAAYALSEATSGSDAMNIRTKAVLSADGASYVLNGEKMWITNAGFADLFTVFAKVDGEKFSAFLVERETPGLTVGKEEHKLGIRGSSTCALVLADCRIPVGNLLGEVGKGHHIAFNILNVGRFKLGVACVGGARMAIEHQIRYAKERRAFGKPIAEFGLIQRKIAASVTRLFVTESMTYRTAGMMDAALAQMAPEVAGSSREIQKRIEEYAVECSILKVFGSEMMGFVADELVQIMGGYGYVEDYPAERLYRDARINRIFEGTNEINRMIITGWLMKRAMNGQLPLLAAIKQLMDEITQPPSFASDEEGEMVLGREAKVLGNLRKITLLAAGAASQRFMAGLQEQQEIMADLADCIMAVFALESALLRARKLVASKLVGSKGGGSDLAVAITSAFADEALGSVEQAARRVLAASSEGDALAIQLTVLRRFVKVVPVDVVALSRTIASFSLDAGRYRF